MNGESRIEADLSRIVAQEPRADPMEGPGPKRIGHDTGVIADHPARDPLDAPRHLGGGPAREGHQQDFAGIGAIDDQVGHPVRQGVGLAGPRPGNDEQWRARRRIVLPDAMLDSPPLFRIEFFEIGDGHWLRISMEAGDPWNHPSRLVRNSPAVAVGLELLAASPDLPLAGQFLLKCATARAWPQVRHLPGKWQKRSEVQPSCPSPSIRLRLTLFA